MSHPKDTEPTRKKQPPSGLRETIRQDLRSARRAVLWRVLDSIEREIERLYPSERYTALLNPEHDWSQ